MDTIFADISEPTIDVEVVDAPALTVTVATPVIGVDVVSQAAVGVEYSEAPRIGVSGPNAEGGPWMVDELPAPAGYLGPSLVYVRGVRSWYALSDGAWDLVSVPIDPSDAAEVESDRAAAEAAAGNAGQAASAASQAAADAEAARVAAELFGSAAGDARDLAQAAATAAAAAQAAADDILDDTGAARAAAQAARDAAQLAETGAALSAGASEASRLASVAAAAAADLAKTGAIDAQDGSEAAKLASETARNAAQTARDQAQTAATNADGSASAASGFAETAETHSDAAGASATAAQARVVAAEAARDAASDSATAAATSASSAASHADDAETSASASQTDRVAAQSARDAAAGSATAAAGSASTASTKATETSQSASAASTSANTATTKAGEASTSASQAAQSKTDAAGSASSAATSATNAANSKNAAGDSATAAAGSASTASTKATDASNSATASQAARVAAESARDTAGGHASAAATSASTAGSHASNAETSASASETSRVAAQAIKTGLEATDKWAEVWRWDGHANAAADWVGATGATVIYSATGPGVEIRTVSAAPYLVLRDPAEAYVAAGGKVRVTVTARAAVTSPSAGFTVSYATNQIGNSGPQTFTPTDAFADYVFIYNRPAGGGGNGENISIQSDTGAASKGLIVKAIKVEKEVALTGVPTAASIAASASAQKAAEANVKASEAGQSATAAQTNATTATTKAGEASTSASQAAQSKTDAAGSASAAATSATNAANSATTAGNSATAASGSASTASTKATEASNSAAAASTAKVAAESARDTAQGHASAASTSASQAGTYAGDAEQSATSASGSANTATTKAGQASTSADQAATSATNAAGSASSASTSATNAAGSATAAGNSATAASGSASSASTSATNAGNSATAANSSKVSAESAYNSTILTQRSGPILPFDFRDGLKHWSNQVTGTVSGIADVTSGTLITNDPDFGTCVELVWDTGGQAFTTKGVLLPTPGQIYEISARFKVTALPPDGAVSIGLAVSSLNDAYAHQGYTFATIAAVSTTGVQEIKATISDTTANGAAYAWLANAKYLRFAFRLPYNETGGATFRLAELRITNVTASVAASRSATAAATSASTATTKATEAGSSASAAASSATAAAGSASGAASSASTATTQASNASGSAASAAASQQVAARLSNGVGCLADPTFSNSIVGAVAPAGWFWWINGGTSVIEDTGTVYGSRVLRMASNSQSHGVQLYTSHGASAGAWIGPRGMEYAVIEVDIELVSGNLTGAGIYINVKAAGGANVPPNPTVDFAAEFGATPPTGRILSARKVVQMSTLATDYQLYAMNNWASLGPATQKDLRWHRIQVRPATTEEIRTFTVDDEIAAAVSVEQSARVTAIGNVEAKYGVKVEANGYVSGFGLLSTANNAAPTSTFAVLADNFKIAKPGVSGGSPKAMFDIGEVDGVPTLVFRGDIIADEVVTTRSIAENAVYEFMKAYTVGALTMSTDAAATQTLQTLTFQLAFPATVDIKFSVVSEKYTPTEQVINAGYPGSSEGGATGNYPADSNRLKLSYLLDGQAIIPDRTYNHHYPPKEPQNDVREIATKTMVDNIKIIIPAGSHTITLVGTRVGLAIPAGFGNPDYHWSNSYNQRTIEASIAKR